MPEGLDAEPLSFGHEFGHPVPGRRVRRSRKCLIRLEPFWTRVRSFGRPIPGAGRAKSQTEHEEDGSAWALAVVAGGTGRTSERPFYNTHRSVFADLVSSSGASTASTAADFLEFVPPECVRSASQVRPRARGPSLAEGAPPSARPATSLRAA
jgi:hypothetical protein